MGEPGPTTREIWLACHGYGQLAEGFLEHFTAIADPHRVIVAPEGLSRFYLDRARDGSHVASAVGASWMTREDRSSEIADQVAYLDAVYEATTASLDLPRVSLTALGFSQGVATACRWVAHTRAKVDRLVCWGGSIPEDVRFGADTPLHHVTVRLIAGTRDEFATDERIAKLESRLRSAGTPFVRTAFVGGHRLDDAMLQQLADEPRAAAV